MTKKSQLAMALEMLDAANASIRSARQIIVQITGEKNGANTQASEMAEGLQTFSSNEGQIIEGVFDGECMAGSDNKNYPIPANYASKSKLVEGDILKLTITPEGKLLYKQVGPIPRRTIIGVAVEDEGKIKILAEGKLYAILFASVTYFKVHVGDKVSLFVPEEKDAIWGAVEAVLPSSEDIPSSLVDEVLGEDESDEDVL